MNLKILSRISGCLIMLLVMLPALAGDVSHSEARLLRESGKIVPLEQIIDSAKLLKPGKVIDTSLEEDDGVYEYDIEILDANGRVWELEFDAISGELMDLELDN